MPDSLTETQVREMLEHSTREGIRQCACAFSNSVAALCRDWLALREQVRGVPVSERLPKTGVDVLLAFGSPYASDGGHGSGMPLATAYCVAQVMIDGTWTSTRTLKSCVPIEWREIGPLPEVKNGE